MWGLLATWPDTPDGFFHLQRTRALGEALRWGVLYPRWFPDFAFGYGYPVLHFYAPLSYYPGALLSLLGLDPLTATRWTLAAGYGLSALIVYLLLRRSFSPAASWVGTALYTFWPYRLYDVFVRGAWPEFHAFLWFPLVLLALEPSVPRARLRRLAVLALFWAGLVLTHNLSAFMMAGLLLLYTVERLFRKGRDGVAAAVVPWVPVAFGGALAAFYALPALMEMKWVGLGGGGEGAVTRHLLAPGALFSWRPLFPYPTADVPTVPLPGYVALLMLLPLVWGVWKRSSLPPRVRWAWQGAWLLLFLLTTWSAPVWQGGHGVLSKLQFPWRWEAPLGMLMTLVAAAMFHLLVPRSPRWQWGLGGGLVLGLAVYALAGLHPQPASLTPADVTVARMWAFDAAHGQVGASWTGEFLPRWVREQRWAIGRAPANPDDRPSAAGVSVTVQRTGYLSWGVEAEASDRVPLVFHVFYYPAWTARVDGRRVHPYPSTNLGLLSVDVPPGKHRVWIGWGGTKAQRWGLILSLLAWGGVWAVLLPLTRGRARWGVAFLFLVWGGVVLWRGVRPEGITVPVRPLQVPYPHVSLVGCAPVPSPRDRVRVRLFWLGREERSQPVSVFVHLVDEEGRVVAQDDAPLGSAYTPPERWFPGLLLSEDHEMRVPGKGGTYRVRVGLYDVHDPAHPFPTPGGQRWVECGEVRGRGG